MIFRETPLAGVFVVEPERIEDVRGWFARVWSPEDFAGRGLETRVAQVSAAWNARAGTLRGMHFQVPPHAEVKLVRCARGAILDVALDLRSSSATYLRSFSVELTGENRTMLYIPEGCAHGYQTLADDTEVQYFISYPYTPEAASGVRWDDPAFDLRWPDADERVLSDRDREWPDFDPAASPF